MITYAVKENDTYAGFSLTNDLERDRLDYVGTPLTLVSIASGEEEVCRNLVDYFTNRQTAAMTPDQFNLTEAVFVLSPAGQALWDSYL